MALVTGKYVDSSGSPLPTEVEPRVTATPSRPFVTDAGVSVSKREQTVTPDPATGEYVLDLAPTIPGVTFEIRGSYLEPKHHGASGLTRRDRFEEQIVVPPEGGSVGDLTVVDSTRGLVWVRSTPPPMSMLWHYIDPTYDALSGAPLPVYTAPDGTTVEHGELVEWSA